MNNNLKRYLTGVALLAASGAASASGSTCDSVLPIYSTCSSGGSCSPYSSASEILSKYPQCFGGSSATSQVQISGSTFQQISSISSVIGNRLLTSGGPTTKTTSADNRSMAAGNNGNWNAWGNVSTNSTRQKYTTGTSVINNDVDITNSVAGADYSLSPGLVLGISVAADSGSGNSQTTGSASDGYSIAPYLGYQLSKNLTLDASVGLGSGKLKMTGGTEAEADRSFYAANLTYANWIDNIQLTGKLGYLHGEENYGNTKVNGVDQASTAAKNKMDRWQLAAQAGYWLNNGMMPYASLAYLTDHRSTSLVGGGTEPIGKDAWQWTLGLNLFSLKSGMTGGIAYNREEGRSNQKNNSLMANINIGF